MVSSSNNQITIQLINGIGETIVVTDAKAVPLTNNPYGECQAQKGQIEFRYGEDLEVKMFCENIEKKNSDTQYIWEIQLIYYYADSDPENVKTMTGELRTYIE